MGEMAPSYSVDETVLSAYIVLAVVLILTGCG